MGHLGLTPQSVHALGGFRVQGKELETARAIVDDAIALAEAGCFAIVLECVPDAVARLVTDSVRCRRSASAPAGTATARCSCSTTCSGSRTACTPKFVRRYAELGADATAAISRFADDVRAGRFPSSEETYHAADTVSDALGLYGSGPVGPAEIVEPGGSDRSTDASTPA